MVHLGYAAMFGFKRISARSWIWLMIFTCTLFVLMSKVNISIILLAMVDSSEKRDTFSECTMQSTMMSTTTTDQSAMNQSANVIKNTFDWNTKLQGMILGSYYWGATLSSIPGAYLAERFGPKLFISLSVGLSSGINMLSPALAFQGPYFLIASRFLIGLMMGPIYPAIQTLIAQWSPPDEKGKFLGALTGASVGVVATWSLLGKILEILDWQWGFYCTGLATLLWTILWVTIVTDSPSTHSFISDEEKAFIANSLSGSVVKKGIVGKTLPPYKEMLLSVSVWGYIALQFGAIWGTYFLLTAGPNFISNMLGFKIGHTGLFASLPEILKIFSGIVFGVIGDFVQKKNTLSTTASRKIFVFFSNILPGIMLLVMTFVNCNTIWALAVLTISLGISGSHTITSHQNPHDLAPNYSGTLMGIANSIATTNGFVSPLVIGYITSERNGLKEWHTIFYIGASTYIASGIIFWLIGSGKVQYWNYLGTENEENKIEEIREV